MHTPTPERQALDAAIGQVAAISNSRPAFADILLPAPEDLHCVQCSDGGYMVQSGDCEPCAVMMWPRYPGKRPGIWAGHQGRTDADGRRWISSMPEHVVDDFGHLVQVPQ